MIDMAFTPASMAASTTPSILHLIQRKLHAQLSLEGCSRDSMAHQMHLYFLDEVQIICLYSHHAEDF